MGRGGFKVKYMIRNGENRPEILDLCGGSVLGLPWDTREDVIRLTMDVNLSAKKQGVQTGESLQPGDEGEIMDAVLTRRVLMSSTPLGCSHLSR